MALLSIVLIALALTGAPRHGAASAGFFDPLAMGPYPVGVTTTLLIDHTRTDALTNEDRALVTEIWYPATDEARELPKNKFSNFVPGGINPLIDSFFKLAFKKSAAEIDGIFWNHSARDARVRDGKFPLVVFSHGNRSIRNQSTFWCDYLASHGYIVVSPDHTGNAALAMIKGKPVLYQDKEKEHSALDRPKDASFLLDQMTLWNGGADSRFAGKLDLSRPTVAGMSFGSYTAIRTADQDPRFKAMIGMAYAPDTHANLQIPSLYMLGGEDRTIGIKGNTSIRSNYTQHTGPSFLLELKNGGHYSFTDIPKIDKNFGDGSGQGKRLATGEPFSYTSMEKTYQAINSYSVAFLGYYVKGEQAYLPFMTKNHWPEDMNWELKGVERNQISSLPEKQ
jgi:predicted dienelactone hydrolase